MPATSWKSGDTPPTPSTAEATPVPSYPAATVPEGTEPTSYIYAADADGHRTIYIFLRSGDTLVCDEAMADPAPPENHTRVAVQVDADGHRHWKIYLAAGDTLGTGRLKPPPPPFP